MSDPTFVLVTGSGATSFLWNPLVTEIALRGHRALPVELPGHGFDAVFPAGYDSPQDTGVLTGAPSPLAGLSLADYAEHTTGVVRRVAEHGPVVLVGHSLGGSTVTRVTNAVPDLLARIVYLSAYCCVDSASVPSYAPSHPAPDSPLARARTTAFLGDPRRTGVSRTNPRTGDPSVLEVQHALLMADLDAARVPAVLAYATQPDEPIQVIIADARVDEKTWGRVPRSYIRTSRDEVVPPEVQDRMIAEADRLVPDNPFTVHTVDGSHFAPISRPAEIADLLVST
ncbi:pimeloyl-ACP methyl ester carboxylesterase [Herbihabitans rhizosphaerae]|uniref:Pimeloyl-ACP methyl ester carboxylesterase n=1 Tax=Herbihabitans rhizosphaerae TaxID=1872711 RepID=A0A4Q7KGL1_9PSEU|nr:alpha/beta fold hydrolase [Herbihabitans rhizosphaerae]RZS34001.1 pimeloyl-ACP methyl ester carboxylesterase [Herbihabitans rhizosphaerae]